MSRMTDLPALHLLLLCATLLCCSIGRVDSAYVEKGPYLYAQPDDPNASFPVIDHLSPQDRGLDPDLVDRPDFLYHHESQGYRIVEFYIPWCNTCKLYAPIYRKFAAKVRELASGNDIAIQTYAVSCSPKANRALCVDQAIKGFPKIRLYKPGSGDYVELAHHTHIQPFAVLERLGIDFEGGDGGEEEAAWDIDTLLEQEATATPQQHSLWEKLWARMTGQDLVSSSQTAAPTVYHRRTRENLKADIHLSFDYAMRNEVFTRSGGLSREQQRALQSWLQVLRRTLPQSWGLTKLVQELLDNFVYIVRSEDYLLAVLDEYPAPTAEQWSLACSHGAADEGYTCGLWELFHTVSVGYVRACEPANQCLAQQPLSHSSTHILMHSPS